MLDMKVVDDNVIRVLGQSYSERHFILFVIKHQKIRGKMEEWFLKKYDILKVILLRQ